MRSITGTPGILAFALMAAMLLAACDALPPPQVVPDAAQYARVAERLRAPPVRPVPATMAELRPPYPCGEHLYMTLDFAEAAGVAYVAGPRRYAVMDIGTGEVIATGAGRQGGHVSDNGRVLAIPVDDGIELRDSATGEMLVLLEGATGDEFAWLGDAGLLFVAPPASAFADSRVVYLDLATGLQSSLLLVSDRPTPNSIFQFGAGPVPGEPGRYLLIARNHAYVMEVVPGPEGRTATLVGTRPELDPEPSWVPSLLVGEQRMRAHDGAIDFTALRGTASPRVALPGFFPTGLSRTGDPDRVLIRGVFADAYGAHLRVGGEFASRDFYYSVSRRRLAPATNGIGDARRLFVPSLRAYVVTGEHTLRAVPPPAAGEEGDVDDVLAAARSEVLAAAIASPSHDPIAADPGGAARAAVTEWHRALADGDPERFAFVDYTADNTRTKGTLEEEFAELRRDVPAHVAIAEITAERDATSPLDEHSRITGRRTFTVTACRAAAEGDVAPRRSVVTVLDFGGWRVAGSPFVATEGKTEACPPSERDDPAA